MEYKRIAIDTSKHVFTLHGVEQPWGFGPATGRNCRKSKSRKINVFLPENALVTNFYTYLQGRALRIGSL